MRTVSAQLFEHDRALARPFSNSKQAWTERQSLLLVLESHGALGVGEASPLPGFSTDSLGSCRDELLRLDYRLGVERASAFDDPVSAEALAALSAPLQSAAARFALESAWLQLLAARRGVPLSQLLGVPRNKKLSLCAVLNPLSKDVLEQAQQLFDSGYRTFKLKVGHDLDKELEVVKLVSTRPGVRLRVDANQAWTVEAARHACAQFARLGVEFIEEPCQGDLKQLRGHSEVPSAVLALDESLLGHDPKMLGRLLARTGASVLVLKPMCHGISRTFAFASRAKELGARVVISHLLGGSVELATLAPLALAVNDAELAAGVAPHSGLAPWKPSHLGYHVGSILRPPRQSSQGLATLAEGARRLHP